MNINKFMCAIELINFELNVDMRELGKIMNFLRVPIFFFHRELI